MTEVQRAAERLVKFYGGIRPAARATGLDHGYLYHLLRGNKSNPSDDVLSKLGIERRVTFRRMNGHA